MQGNCWQVCYCITYMNQQNDAHQRVGKVTTKVSKPCNSFCLKAGCCWCVADSYMLYDENLTRVTYFNVCHQGAV